MTAVLLVEAQQMQMLSRSDLLSVENTCVVSGADCGSTYFGLEEVVEAVLWLMHNHFSLVVIALVTDALDQMLVMSPRRYYKG
jgi:hypothetical protein